MPETSSASDPPANRSSQDHFETVNGYKKFSTRTTTPSASRADGGQDRKHRAEPVVPMGEFSLIDFDSHLILRPHEADGVSKIWVTTRHEAGGGQCAFLFGVV